MSAEFDSLWKSLGLAGAAKSLPATETITPRTLAAARATAAQNAADPATTAETVEIASTPSAAQRHGDERDVGSVTIPTLPRLAVSHASSENPAEAARASSTGGAPDLEIKGLLGEGGMGRVLLARQRSLNRDVAIKMVRPEVEAEGLVRGLLREALVTGHLEHPSIIPVHALGRDASDRPMLVMKRVEGVSWRALLRDPEHRAWKTLGAERGERLVANLEVVLQVCNAVHFAHARGFVHRDLKPENVMIGDFGEVYLLDWGIAQKLGRKGDAPGEAEGAALVGTPAYMAPEMVSSAAGEVDERTDVYLLGATLHEALTGSPRHEGDGLYEVLYHAFESRPFAYDDAVPRELAAICNRATAARKDDRFASVIEFRKAVQDYLRHRGSLALTQQALARLDEARALWAEDPKAHARRIYQLLAECRFGFAQALREHDENAAAREGLRACLALLVEHEIAQGNAEGAHATLEELTDAEPALHAKLAALREEIEARRVREERLSQLDREFDLSVGSRQRTLVFVALAAAVIGISVWAIAFRPRGTPAQTITPTVLVRLSLVMLAIVGTAIVALRRHVLRNTINRRFALLLVLWMCSMLAHRLVGLRHGTPASVTLAGDMVLGAAMSAVGGLAIMPWLFWITGVFACGATLATLVPSLANLAMTVTGFAGIVIGALGVRGGARE